MLMVAVGWQMYDLTSSAWDLGLVGLLQFLPALALVLIPTCSRSICGYRSPFVATVRRSWPPFALSLSKGFDGLSPNGIHMLSPPASAPSRYGP